MLTEGQKPQVTEQKVGGALVKHIEPILTAQKRNEDELVAAAQSGKHSFESPYIMINPYVINPLAAVIAFTAKDEDVGKTLSLTVCGRIAKGGRTGGLKIDKKVGIDFHFTYPVTKNMLVPVLGLYPKEETRLVLEIEGQQSVLEISVPYIEMDEYAAVTTMRCEPRYLDGKLVILSSATRKLAIGVDEHGDVRWCRSEVCAWQTRPLQNGHFLMTGLRYFHAPYYYTGNIEASLIGKIYGEYDLPGGSHHDALELPNGNFVFCSNDFSRSTLEDIAYELDRKTGKIVDTFDLYPLLSHEMGHGPGLNASPADWFHNNSVDYLPEKDWLIFSGRHCDAIVCLNRGTKKIEWIIGNPETWPAEYQKYFFKPVEGAFEWPYTQHSAIFLSANDVICFDNHTFAAKTSEKSVLNKDNYSRGVEYHIDTEKMTIEQTWECGKQLGPRFFSAFIGNVAHFGPGHYMVHSGGMGYNAQGEAVPGVPLIDPYATLLSETICVKDGEVQMDLEINTNTYRADIIKLESWALEAGEGLRLGTLGVAEEFETIPDTGQTASALPEEDEVIIDDENDRVVLRAVFHKGDLVMFLVDDGEKTHPYFISTSSAEKDMGSLGLCAGTFVKENTSPSATERRIALSISKEGWKKGPAAVSFIINDTRYDLGKVLTQ